MVKIKLNTTEFTLESYNRNTYFSVNGMDSTANCVIYTDDISVLNTLAQSAITVVQILVDDEIIYNLQNITARIDNISEYLSDNKINININLRFDIAQ